MGVTDNRAAARRIIEAFSTGDLSRVDTLIAPDYLDHQGLGGTMMTGPGGFNEVVKVARAGYSELSVRIDDLIAEGDKVVAWLHWHGVRSPSGEIAERETIEIMRFVDGRSVEHWGARSTQLSPAKSSPDGKVVSQVTTDDGVTLWSESQGQGPGMVLCHGGPGLCDYLGPLASLLDGRFRVHRYDQRGGGRSEGAEGPFTIDRFIRDLDSVRASAGYGSWVVGGHSWGASLALYYALAHPDRVRGLLYISGTGLEWEKWKSEHSLIAQRRRLGPYAQRHEELGAKQSRRTAEEEREFNILNWATDYVDLSDGLVQAAQMADTGFAVNRECNSRLNAEVRQLDAEDLRQQCSALRLPVLIVHGELDPRPAKAVDSLVVALPNVERVDIPSAAHFPWHERKAEFQRVVSEWLDRLDA